jgi:hypothetical protein
MKAIGVESLRILFGINEWLAGYLSALNDTARAPKRVSSEDLAVGSFGFLAGYCTTHPASAVLDAARAWAGQQQNNSN